MEITEEWVYRLALRLIPGIGDKLYKQLIANCGSAKSVYEARGNPQKKIPGIGPQAIRNIKEKWAFNRAEAELQFMERNGIKPLFYLDKAYPNRLKWCEDGPVILYTKGNYNYEARPTLAMVGTRNATRYGLEFCEKFIRDMLPFSPVIVSGLAYGIDIKCHREAMENGLPTLALLAHGLDRVYPSIHRKDSNRILENGALISEFMSGVQPDRENFPRRNRIVAGMCDAVLVVEAAVKGGALITAEIANTYNREVFAVPGRLGDRFSEGCNYLIKHNKASLVTSVKDLEYLLNWSREDRPQGIQQSLPLDLPDEEEQLLRLIQKEDDGIELAKLGQLSKKRVSRLLQLLMSLELKGLVISLPGQRYSLRDI